MLRKSEYKELKEYVSKKKLKFGTILRNATSEIVIIGVSNMKKGFIVLQKEINSFYIRTLLTISDIEEEKYVVTGKADKDTVRGESSSLFEVNLALGGLENGAVIELKSNTIIYLAIAFQVEENLSNAIMLFATPHIKTKDINKLVKNTFLDNVNHVKSSSLVGFEYFEEVRILGRVDKIGDFDLMSYYLRYKMTC